MISIYPTQKEFLNETEKYFESKYSDFYNQFTKRKWLLYYEKKVYPGVSLYNFMNFYAFLHNFNYFFIVISTTSIISGSFNKKN